MFRNILFSSDESDDDEVPQRHHNRRQFKVRINFEHINGFQFKESFRLSMVAVEFVENAIGADLFRITRRNHSLTPRQQLLVTLHWLGNGSQYHGIAAMHGVSKASVCRVVYRVTRAIINRLLRRIVCWPNNPAVAQDFFRKGGFPSVCGCVDGTLINIDAPTVHEEQYIDRHGKHSINAMVICGPDFKFYAVNANWPGSVHDARVLRNSLVSHRFDDGWRPFPGAIILGDSAYGLKEWLIPPLNRNPNDAVEQRYNRAHKQTRRLVENSIGICKERFPCLNYLRLSPQRASVVIICCAVLHNIACTYDEVEVRNEPDEEENDPIRDAQEEVQPINGVRRVERLLNFFR